MFRGRNAAALGQSALASTKTNSDRSSQDVKSVIHASLIFRPVSSPRSGGMLAGRDASVSRSDRLFKDNETTQVFGIADVQQF